MHSRLYVLGRIVRSYIDIHSLWFQWCCYCQCKCRGNFTQGLMIWKPSLIIVTSKFWPYLPKLSWYLWRNSHTESLLRRAGCRIIPRQDLIQAEFEVGIHFFRDMFILFWEQHVEPFKYSLFFESIQQAMHCFAHKQKKIYKFEIRLCCL